ncbi:hypothetical protein [Bradyrhizobium sp. CB2312]|uniref:hypothetical protein n=1 Tax=Bradyrhizobium sp. CB2312 TaxID=3039155 RepID=UPI0024B2786E|nr:hypothetical protein [Bradyrhizobium sp. CB2312]WFU74268.1 hypothetical protein QA642_09570 [Bradyrhizobium sp. CB2312]
MTIQEPLSLADIATQFSTIDPSFTSFHGKLFSFIPPDPQRFHDLCRSLTLKADIFPNRHPAIAIVRKLAS